MSDELDAVDVRMINIDDLKDDPFQTRVHSDRNIGIIEESLRRVGTGRSIVADEDLTTLAGHGVKRAAKNIGIKRAMIVDVPADVLLVRRVKGLTGQQKLFLANADNRASDTSTFDARALQQAINAGLDWSPLWSQDEIDPVLHAEWTPPPEEPLPDTENRRHGNKTPVWLTPAQEALVKQVQSLVDEEMQGSDDVDAAKAIEIACKLFLQHRKRAGS